ncbi:MAG: SMI1/KNR4 family protein [Candidatus Thiodiazotropha taylori]
MVTSNLSKSLKELLQGDDTYGPVAHEEVDAAESKLGIRFPLSYRTFLIHFGASVGHPSIAGLPNTRSTDKETPYFENILDLVAQVKRIDGDNIPNSYIPFSDDGAELKFYFDVGSIDSQGECSIVALGPGVSTVVAHSLDTFIQRFKNVSLEIV